jgi:hypothetical protein
VEYVTLSERGSGQVYECVNVNVLISKFTKGKIQSRDLGERDY